MADSAVDRGQQPRAEPVVRAGPPEVAIQATATPGLQANPEAYRFNDAAASVNSVLANPTNPQDFCFPLASLANVNDQTASFGKVQAIQTHACTQDTAFGYTLDCIRAVPEPSTALTALAATVILGLYRGRRRQGPPAPRRGAGTGDFDTALPSGQPRLRPPCRKATFRDQAVGLAEHRARPSRREIF